MASRSGYLIFLYTFFFSALAAQDIFEAARKGDVQRMAALAKMKPDTLNDRDANGFTPLIIAGYRNQVQSVIFLLDRGVNINASSPEGPVLLGACYKSNEALAQLLIERGADVNAQNGEGITALMYAAMTGNIQLVKLLIKNRAKKNQIDQAGKKALDYIGDNPPKELRDLLLE